MNYYNLSSPWELDGGCFPTIHTVLLIRSYVDSFILFDNLRRNIYFQLPNMSNNSCQYFDHESEDDHGGHNLPAIGKKFDDRGPGCESRNSQTSSEGERDFSFEGGD